MACPPDDKPSAPRVADTRPADVFVRDHPCDGCPSCCGCTQHPVGEPSGWNAIAWEQHYDEHHPLPPQPAVGYDYISSDFA